MLNRRGICLASSCHLEAMKRSMGRMLLLVFLLGLPNGSIAINAIRGSSGLITAKIEPECMPFHAYESEEAACRGCHKCRTHNKCPCSVFPHGDEFNFCYDSEAADMNHSSPDGHNVAMHCKTLMTKNVKSKLCSGNAIDEYKSQSKSQSPRSSRISLTAVLMAVLAYSFVLNGNS
mmetsp:Transcript_148194/g.270049  ORF Transcript_148194/g.270049 Transcript_148194/m.270049 type:complete len:176 (+) Transcript_148194:3-530(+)